MWYAFLYAQQRVHLLSKTLNTMVERIREILQANQLTPTQFADTIGVARPIISHILSGRNKPSLEVVQKIVAAFPAISLPWLLSGAGAMLAASPRPVAADATTVVLRQTPSEQQTTSRTAPRKAPKEALPAKQAATPDAGRPANAAISPGSLFDAQAPTPTRQPPISAAAPVAPVQTPQSETVAPSVSASVTSSSPELPATGPAAPVSLPPAATVPSDARLASAFAEPGKTIRRIVIFYQDGTFTDYQPESRA